MFVKIDKENFVNLDQLAGIKLNKDYKGFFWEFFTSATKTVYDYNDYGQEEKHEVVNVIAKSPSFHTKADAFKWFQDTIEPALKDYSNAKSAPFEIATFLDQIVIPLQKLVKQEV